MKVVISAALLAIFAAGCPSPSSSTDDARNEIDATAPDVHQVFSDATDGTETTDVTSRDVSVANDVAVNGFVISPLELIFSGARGTISAPQSVLLNNAGTVSVNVNTAALALVDAPGFHVSSAINTPFMIAPGAQTSIAIEFAPTATQSGSLHAALQIATTDPTHANVTVDLYGLATLGAQGGNEPTLASVVQTLGYSINVGGTGLTLGTSANLIGDEVHAPLFQRATAGTVSLRPVARYSPDEIIPYGYYLPAATPTLNMVGAIDMGQDQTLDPTFTTASLSRFDPGNQSFGIYVHSAAMSQDTFTQDALNRGPVAHAVRAYPIHDRAGTLVPNTYLLCFEEASNGDYQDFVFVLSNAQPIP